jgi:hypothetical protein
VTTTSLLVSLLLFYLNCYFYAIFSNNDFFIKTPETLINKGIGASSPIPHKKQDTGVEPVNKTPKPLILQGFEIFTTTFTTTF